MAKGPGRRPLRTPKRGYGADKRSGPNTKNNWYSASGRHVTFSRGTAVPTRRDRGDTDADQRTPAGANGTMGKLSGVLLVPRTLSVLPPAGNGKYQSFDRLPKLIRSRHLFSNQLNQLI